LCMRLLKFLVLVDAGDRTVTNYRPEVSPLRPALFS